jgi:hypothetical protein
LNERLGTGFAAHRKCVGVVLRGLKPQVEVDWQYLGRLDEAGHGRGLEREPGAGGGAAGGWEGRASGA